MTKYRQNLSLYSKYPLLLLLFPFLSFLPYTVLGQCPGTACTYTITGPDSGTYTVNTGQKICLDTNADFTGIIDLQGGEVNNCATNAQTFSFDVAAFGTLDNYGIIDYPTNHTFVNGLTVNNYLTLNFSGNLTVQTGSTIFNNFGTTTILGGLLNQSQVNNSGTLTITGDISENTSAVLSNSGAITTDTWTVNGQWDNSGTIDIAGTFSQGVGKIGTINGGCLSSTTWNLQGTITGNICGDINISGSSLLSSSGSLLGDIAIIDATPPGSAPFIDNSFGTVGPNIVWSSCNSCPSEEICNNSMDDDQDGYTDGDDPDCITAGSCGCPPGGTIITSLPFGHITPPGSSHCLDADEVLTAAWNNISIQGNLYILAGNTLTVSLGDIFFNGDGTIIICEGAGYVNQVAAANPSNIYNNGWLQVCGNNADIDNLILGENSITALKADNITINDTIRYVGNTGGSAYIFLDPTTNLNGISSGNVCLPGSSDIVVQSNNGSITPTCVTDCNGCTELSTISGTCNDGSVETAYLALNPSLEICGNSVDDNGDGRIDEPFPGGVQTNMQLWLKAETGTNTTIDGNDVTSWGDQSINGYSADADVNSTDDPTYSDNELNYNPGIVFDGTYTDDFSDGLHLGSDYIYSTNDGVHIFAVVNTQSGGLQYDKVYEFGGTFSDGYGLGWSNSSTRSTTPAGSGGATSFINHFTGVEPSLLEFEIKFNNNQTVYKDGNTVVTTPGITLSQLTAAEIAESDHYGTAANGDDTSGPVSIGRKSASEFLDQDRVFMGSISEVLVYNDTLTQIEKERIQSYLALKYGMTMPHDYIASSGITLKDVTDGYANDIFGIGRDDCSGLSQRQSKSNSDENILSIALNNHATTNATHPNNLTVDESFLIIGHNNVASNTTWTTATDNYESLDRVWKMDNTNYNQNTEFSLSVDNPNFDLPDMPAGADGNYYILFGSDPDFTTGALYAVALTNFDGNMTYSESFGLPATLPYFTFGVFFPQVEICNNSIDDNGDGRIDESFPGGVQEDMQLWLKAETGTNTTVDGNDITSWGDQSVNGYSADADINSTDDPTFSENAINFNPGVDFDGIFTDGYSDGLHLGSDYIFGEKDGIHVFVVCDPDVVAGTDKYVFDFGVQSNGGYGMIYSDNDYGMYTNSSFGGTNTELFHSEGEEPALVEMEIDFDNAQEFYRNGDLLSSIPVTISDLDETKVLEGPAYGALGTTTGPVSIGRKSASAFLDQNGGRMFDGRISEVIVFTDTLSSLEKQKVNSYLAVKYGLTMIQNYLSSTGTLQKDINDGYANDIAGIGRDDCSGLHQKQSKSIESEAIVTIGQGTIASTNDLNANSITSDDAYLIWGNDGAPINANWVDANVTIPGVDFASIDRTWKFSENLDITNTLFQIDVDNPNFDLPAMPATADGIYYLLRDDDGDFTNGGTTYEPMSFVSGDDWQTTIADPMNNEYFTIAVGTACLAQAPTLSK